MTASISSRVRLLVVHVTLVGLALSVASVSQAAAEAAHIVANGTSLSDLGIDEPIVLDGANPAHIVPVVFPDGAGQPDASGNNWTRFNLRYTVEFPAASPSPPGAQSILSVSVAGHAAVQLIFEETDRGTVQSNGIGWLEGRKVTEGDPGQRTLDGTYENFLVDGSVEPGPTELTLLFEPSEHTPGAVATIHPDSSFAVESVSPVAIDVDVTEIKSVAEGTEVTYVATNYRMRSTDIEVVFVFDGQSPEAGIRTPLTLAAEESRTEGILIPAADVDAAGGRNGLLVLVSDEFNSPAVPISFIAAEESSMRPWLVAGGLALMVGAAAFMTLPGRRRKTTTT